METTLAHKSLLYGEYCIKRAGPQSNQFDWGTGFGFFPFLLTKRSN